MDPGKLGEFRLSLRDASGTARSVTIADFDLRSVHYEVKSPKCHELSLATPPHDRISFNFRCEQEAQEWATVMMSSLREAHRVAENPSTEDSQPASEASEPQNSSALPRMEETCAELTRAIEDGDMQAASLLAVALARQQATLRIQPSARSAEETEISLAVVVEDSSTSCCVTVKVFPQTTIAALKQQVFLGYGFHPRVQRWVIGQCLCADQRSLASYGVRRDGDTAFLYLLTARHSRLTPQMLQQDQESALLLLTPSSNPPPSSLHPQPAALSGSFSAPLQDWRAYSTMPPQLNENSTVPTLTQRPPFPPVSPGPHAAGWAEKVNGAELRDLIHLEMPQLSQALSPSKASSQGWACPSCTYINKPTRPGCEICSTDRPEGYTVPGGYRPDPLELRRIQQEKEAVHQYQLEKGRREELRGAAAPNSSLLLNLDQDY